MVGKEVGGGEGDWAGEVGGVQAGAGWVVEGGCGEQVEQRGGAVVRHVCEQVVVCGVGDGVRHGVVELLRSGAGGLWEAR